MYKYITIILLSLIIPNTYTVLPDSSSIEWIGSKVGGSHNGFIKISSGEVTLEDNKVKSSQINVDMNTMTNVDVKSEGSRNYLLNHLKSDDFFGVKNFPSSNIAFIQFDEDSTNTILTCDITIKGITNRVKFPVDITVNKDTAIATGTVTIDRTKHNIKYKSKTFFKDIGDRFIYDDFNLNFKIFAQLNKEEK